MEVRLSERAVRDLEKLDTEQGRIAKLLLKLGDEPSPSNVDVRRLQGRAPWSRARVGRYRVIFRPLTETELADLDLSGRGILVYRIVHRRDLERAISGL